MKKSNIKNIFKDIDIDVAKSNSITVQTKFSLCDEQHIILNETMEHLTNCFFVYFNLLTSKNKLNNFVKQHSIYITKEKIDKNTKEKKLVKELENLKVTFCRVFQISSRQFNSIDVFVNGLIDSNKELMKINLVSYKEQLNSKNKKINQLKAQLNLLEFSHSFKLKEDKTIKRVNQLRLTINKLKESIDRKKASIEKLEKKIQDNKISVCFGDTKILKRLSSLYNDSHYDNNKYINTSLTVKKHYQKIYRKLWQDSRFKQFLLVGSKDENNGNSSCVFNKKSESLYSIKISIPEYVINKLSLKCKYLYIDNINFKHNEKEILNTLSINNERKQKEQEYNLKLKNKDPSLFNKDGELIKKAEYLKDYGSAMTFRFIKETYNDPNREIKKDSNNWTLQISMEETKCQKAITSKSNGVISIDINADHLAIANINKNLTLKKAFKIDFGFTDKKLNFGNQLRKEYILKSVKQIIEYAIENKKPIVIENLDFTRKRAMLAEDEVIFNSQSEKAAKKKNRILSSFAYSKIIEYIKQLAYRNGIAVYEVNPAFTSQLGFIKYAKRYGISRHMAAAYVIGRRSYGIEELFERNDQVIVKDEVITFDVQVDRSECSNYFEYCNQNLKGFQRRLMAEYRGKKPKSTQIAKPLGISI